MTGNERQKPNSHERVYDEKERCVTALKPVQCAQVGKEGAERKDLSLIVFAKTAVDRAGRLVKTWI
jgi:hypothetical protein